MKAWTPPPELPLEQPMPENSDEPLPTSPADPVEHWND
ncbi:MAG: hypothetical protein FD153_1524, partial [Rhodospirillaceae bacterium]